MVRVFYKVFAALALVSGSAADIKCTHRDDYWGGEGGYHFVDQVNRETNLTGVVLRSQQRLDAIGIIVDGAELNLHGGNGGIKEVTDLQGKKITAIEVHKAKNGGHMKVVYVELTVEDGNPIYGGLQDLDRKLENIKKFEAHVEGGYLLGFVGRADKEVDALGGIWLDPECAKRKRDKKRKRDEDDYGDNEDDSSSDDKVNDHHHDQHQNHASSRHEYDFNDYKLDDDDDDDKDNDSDIFKDQFKKVVGGKVDDNDD